MQKFFLLILCSLIALSVEAQNQSVTGRVTSSDGEPIVGVTIQNVKGNSYTISGVDGVFEIGNVNAETSLIFNYLGMNEKVVVVGSKSHIEVVMTSDAIVVDDVVVVGYGTMRKSDLTGSVASVKVEGMLEASSASTFEAMLQGRVAGVQVINSGNDDPDSSSTVRVRGRSSINGSNSPLVVLNGVPIGDAGGLETINPSIIKSIEVLKDASSTAIYGSRGANGVIMVTTKDGEQGRTSVYVENKTTIGYFSKELDYYKDAALMIELDNEKMINGGYSITYDGTYKNGTYYPSLEEVQSGAYPYYTTWADYSYRDVSVTNELSLGIQGGNEKSNYRMNLTRYDGEGMKIGDDFNKTTIDFDYSNQVSRILRLSTRAGFFTSYDNDNTPGTYTRNPLYPVYNGDGSYFKISDTDYDNVVATRDNKIDFTNTLSGYATMQLDVDIIKDLTLVLRGDFRASLSEREAFYPMVWTSNGDSNNTRGVNSMSESYTTLYDGYLTYSKVFNNDHSFSAMAGGSIDLYSSESLYAELNNYDSEILSIYKISVAADSSVSNSLTEAALVSGFTRFNYDYKKRYYATFTARTDGSSKFGDNNKWGYFPSGAVSWRASEESFIKDLDIFHNLKIRASYGISGNQGIPAYQTQTTYSWFWSTYQGDDLMVYGPSSITGTEGEGGRYKIWSGIGNESLRWEKTAQTDIGVDMGLFGGRLNIVFDYYNKITSDLLLEKYLALNTGYDTMWANVGSVRNRGIELSIDGQIYSDKNWSVSSSFIYSRNKNLVLDLGGVTETGLTTDVNGITYMVNGSMGSDTVFSDTFYSILAEGQPMGVFYGYQVDGIIQEPNGDGALNQPGEFNYVGLQSDGTLDSDARTIIGDPNPDFSSSFNLSVTHRLGFDFGIQFYGVFGGDVISTTKYTSAALQSERWTYDNPTNLRPSLRSSRGDVAFSDWFVEDGSFIRLQNITLGYSFTNFSIAKSGRVYVSLNNPCVWSSSTLYDPEVDESGWSTPEYSKVSTAVFGVQLNF